MRAHAREARIRTSRAWGQPVAALQPRAGVLTTARYRPPDEGNPIMARTLQLHYRRRRTQRWLRREVLLLSREQERFDCAETTREAQRLVDIVEGRAGFLYELRSA